jgi:hypothetical protein
LRDAAIKGSSGNKDRKTFLRKVAVIGEDFGDAFLSASVHGDTVCQAIAFICTLLIQAQTVQKGLSRQRKNGNLFVR